MIAVGKRGSNNKGGVIIMRCNKLKPIIPGFRGMNNNKIDPIAEGI